MVTLQMIQEAQESLKGIARKTPLENANRLGENIYIKSENLQLTGAFKIRGAYNKIRSLTPEEASHGVIACSAGNHAQGIALSATKLGIKSVICMPEGAPISKVEATRNYGAEVVLVPGVYDDAAREAERLSKEHGYTFAHPFNDPYVIAGQGTIGLEILEQLGWQAPDYIALSVGDGCTIAGAWKGLKDLYAAGFIDRLPRLISVQAEGCCPLNRAIETGKPWEPMAENTLADSIAVGVPRNPDKALCAIRESDGVAVNVSDGEILEAMRLLGRTQGVFGEPAGAAGTAGVKKAVELGLIPAGSTVVSIVTGNGMKDVQSGIQAAGEPMRVSPDMDALLAAFAAQDLRP